MERDGGGANRGANSLSLWSTVPLLITVWCWGVLWPWAYKGFEKREESQTTTNTPNTPQHPNSSRAAEVEALLVIILRAGFARLHR
jgi:hypothetical protein